MEFQKQIISGVFTKINAYPTSKTPQNQILSELKVSLAKYNDDTHLLILTSKCLYLQKINQKDTKIMENQIYAANIQFQLSFQFQSAVQNNIKSKKIGISFLKGPNNILRLYSLQESSIICMRNQLMRLINERRFHEQYVPFDKLGKGSFATVYAVFKTQTREKFAVKAFSKANMYSIDNGKQALKNQLQIMRTVSNSSKNLLSLYGIYETQNSIYAVQTLLQGKSLQYLISRERTAGCTYDQTRYIMLGILNAVKTLHRMKIMHRDLKPENVIFKKESMQSPHQYDPVIVDYGMCQNYQKMNYIFFRCGTPGYVAPEVAKLQTNSPYSPACDMFSIGCLFHLIMTGCPIFDSKKHEETLKKNKFLEFTMKKNRVKKKHPLAMNLLLRLLQPIPSMRITAQQALQNDFFGNLKVMRSHSENKKLNQIQQKYVSQPLVNNQNQISINKIKQKQKQILPSVNNQNQIPTNEIQQKQISQPPVNNQNQQAIDLQALQKNQIQQTRSTAKRKKSQKQTVLGSQPLSPKYQSIKSLYRESQENILTRESIKSQTRTSINSQEMLIEVSPRKRRFAF